MTTEANSVTLELHQATASTSTSASDQLLDVCKTQLKNLLGDAPISSGSLHIIIKYTMELIEDTPLKGQAQKDFALKLLRDVFKEATDGAEEKALLSLLDNGAIGNMIDLIVDASKGKLNINSLVKVSEGCFTTCLPYLLKRINTSKNKNKKKNKENKEK